MNKRSNQLAFILLIAVTALLTLACRLTSMNLFPFAKMGLQLNERAKDGQVSGSFVFSEDQVEETVQFSVSSDGLAGFWIEDSAEEEILTVDIRQSESAGMSWKGVQLDGHGALSDEEKAALDNLLSSDLAYGLGLIPLDIACQEDGLVDPVQVAALLYPLQMRFKYQITDRTETASLLASLSQCNYDDNETDASHNSSMVIMMPSSPVPVVFGYFPFDPDGALEVSIAPSNDIKLASLNTQLLAGGIENPMKITLSGISSIGAEAIRDEWGPCKAKCRGACGSDCTTSNCKLSVEDRCEKNQDGLNDGFKSIVHIYDCGLHPGCIKHDDCYDACNSYYGCDSFSATVCMHATTLVSTPFEYFSESYLSCDSEVLIEEGISNSLAWMGGSGPQPTRQVYEYTDPDYGYEYDPVSCPLGETSAAEKPEINQDGDQDAPDSSESNEESVNNTDENNTIPAGTYIGETTFYKAFEGSDYSNPVCIENSIQLVVDSDGAVQGNVKAICYSKSDYDSGNDESGITFHRELTGLIQGTVLDSEDQLSISYTYRYYATSPQWEVPSLDTTTEFIFTYNVQVLENVMKLTPAGDVQDFYSFTLYKD